MQLGSKIRVAVSQDKPNGPLTIAVVGALDDGESFPIGDPFPLKIGDSFQIAPVSLSVTLDSQAGPAEAPQSSGTDTAKGATTPSSATQGHTTAAMPRK